MKDLDLSSIAVVGMAGRFPGAASIDEFWNNLESGKESITRLDSQKTVLNQVVKPFADRVFARGILENAEYFDASFFGYSTREAENMDPQHRVFLETCWEALEHAGYDVERINVPVGLFAGTGMNTYLLYNLCTSRKYIEEFLDNHQVNALPALIGNDKDFLVSRVAYKLGLKGPAINVQSACSTSLVAVTLAWQSLMSFQCDMALAGGVSISFPQNRSYSYTEGAMVSKEGKCRAFDKNAQGMLYGAGAGVVVMKRLRDALNDGDSIYGVISGAAVNNDGAAKVSYLAPSIDGQAAVVQEAQELAGISPDSITYIEAHGTGTPLGDPIEIAGLTKAFRAATARKQYCAIGSVKTNIGHLETAAGIAGLIKTLLALQNKKIPASLNFRAPNPKIDFKSSPFFVNAELRPWEPQAKHRIAGVSSFGVGGTNAHVIVQEPPVRPDAEALRPQQLLVLSARTSSALQKYCANLADFLETHADGHLADIAHTLQVGRRQFDLRYTTVAETTAEAITALRQYCLHSSDTEATREKATRVAFMFPGQGAQHVNMGVELYHTESVFRDAVTRCSEILKAKIGIDLRSLIYPGKGIRNMDTSSINQTGYAQPAIFAIEYGLAQLWMSWGIRPSVVIGHSIGEYVAAVLAGVMELQEALLLLAARANMMQALPPGAMIAVHISDMKLAGLLPEGCSIAAVNSPHSAVASGTFEAIEKLQEVLDEREIAVTPLATSHAFHSAMMDPMLAEFQQCARHIDYRSPRIPWISTKTGESVTIEELQGGSYWVGQIREPVRFADAIAKILADGKTAFLEVGPGQTLSQLTRQNMGVQQHSTVVPSLGHPKQQISSYRTVLTGLGNLWSAGIEVDWKAFTGKEVRKRIALPTYPFERKKYWVEPASIAEFQWAAEPELLPEMQQKEQKMPVNQSADSASSVKQQIMDELKTLLLRYSGDDYSKAHPGESFMDLGFDSIFLTQFSQGVSQHFSLKITFRQMMEDLTTLDSLSEYIAREKPPEVIAAQTVQQTAPVQATPHETGSTVETQPSGQSPVAGKILQPANSLQDVIQQQLSLMEQQLQLVSQNASPRTAVNAPFQTESGQASKTVKPAKPMVIAARFSKKSHFGPFKEIEKGIAGGLTDCQQKGLNDLIQRYNRRTAKSKAYAEQHRSYFCDPRAAGNFKQLWKEMVYPLVCVRSKGSRIWDLDGNEYLDITMGFGANYLGHSPDFVVEALSRQLEAGMEIGPQSNTAGDVARMICELSGMERATFCNTGSEAVMAAIRVARTVSNREKIVYFQGDYHGVFDEVLGCPAFVDGEPGAMAIAPGIPHLAEVMVLEYGNPGSLDTIRNYASDIACVIVEPVQSRNPGLQPRDFLHELRALTGDHDIALVFDEIITGFRIAPGGAQEHFGVKADMATYGKVIGGGMPLGVLTGSAAYLDALDGGYWQYGDSSSPPAGVTFFAGTFVRHPLTMASAKATLEYLMQQGSKLQEATNTRTANFVKKMNRFFEERELPMKLQSFSSLFYYDFHSDLKYANLIFYYMRDRGIHIFEGRGGFISTAHDDKDMEMLLQAFKASVDEMQVTGFLPAKPIPTHELVRNNHKQDSNSPPAQEACLGRDPVKHGM